MSQGRDPIWFLLDESQDDQNPRPETLQELLSSLQLVAVVGLSRDPTKPARRVPSYLAAKGIDVIPVNPFADRILGRKALASLDDVAEAVDLVLVFRPSEDAGAVVRQAAGRDEAPAIWLQEGIVAPGAVQEARRQGRLVVQDLCIFKVHRLVTGNAGSRLN